jgi:uncharacterized protein
MMQWLNEPQKWHETDHQLTVTTEHDTDFWRITHYDFIRHSGHFYYREASGDFVAEVKITGEYRDLYDQAGLMLRLDEFNWLKCGIELVEDVQQASVVVTREVSDWSVVALPHNPPSISLRLKRAGDGVEVFYSLDEKRYTMMRLAYFPTTNPVQVGMMCASPKGEGFTVTFEGFSVKA